MALPRPRFTIQGLMVSVAIVSVAFAVLSPDGCYVGFDPVTLRFLVLNASTGQPIEGASIGLNPASKELPAHEAVTGPDGRTEVDIQAPAFGRSRGLRFIRYPWQLTLSHDRYATLSDDLGGIIKGLGTRGHSTPPPIVLRLEASSESP